MLGWQTHLSIYLLEAKLIELNFSSAPRNFNSYYFTHLHPLANLETWGFKNWKIRQSLIREGENDIDIYNSTAQL